MKLGSIGALSLVIFLILGAVASPAASGVYGDQLTKCLVDSTSQKDRNVLIRWVFAAMASHPEVSELASVSMAERDELNRQAAGLFTHLLTESCASETRQAVKNEGTGVMETSFGVLGQIAMRGLMSDPAVTAYLAGLEKNIDSEKLKEVLGTD